MSADTHEEHVALHASLIGDPFANVTPKAPGRWRRFAIRWLRSPLRPEESAYLFRRMREHVEAHMNAISGINDVMRGKK